MKKIILLLLLSVSIFSFSQVKTSEEDYNYLKNELKKELSLGNTIKQDHKLTLIETNNLDKFKFSYFLFTNTKTNETKAIYIDIVKEDKKQVNLVLPFNNPALLDKFTKDAESLGISMKMYFDQSIYNILQKSLEKIANRPGEKKESN